MKEKIVTIDAEGRDKGKSFLLREMPALRAEKWGYRALLAVSRSGADLPDNVLGSGMAQIAVMGVKALTKIRFEDAEPLLDDLLSCVLYHPGGGIPARALVETDIEEWTTLVKLRMEVLDLHIGFFTPGDHPTSRSPTMPKPNQPGSPNIPIHPARSRGSSRPGRQA